MKKFLLVSLMLALALSLGGAVEAARPVLRVGSDVTYAPFEFADAKTGEFMGFDVELIRAIGKAMGMEVEIKNTAWDGIIPGLLNGNYDVLISAMTITDERAQAVNFSDPYFTAGQVIVIRNSNDTIKEPKDLKGKVVAVQINTTGDYAAQKVEGVAKISRFNTTPEALQEVINGAAEAAVIDLPVAKTFMKENPGKVRLAGPSFTVEYYGIAVKKSNEVLLKKVNKALATLKANGTYEKIYEKWFGAGK